MLPLLTVYHSKDGSCRCDAMVYSKGLPCILQILCYQFLIHREFLFVIKWDVAANKFFLPPTQGSLFVCFSFTVLLICVSVKAN